MSVVSISLVVDMSPSENEGSAVLSIRTMAGFASAASEISDAVGCSVPSKVTLRATGSARRCRECSSIEVVLTLVQNSLEHKPVEVHGMREMKWLAPGCLVTPFLSQFRRFPHNLIHRLSPLNSQW